MNPTLNNYDLLLQKLDEFIRKYYKNQLIRGAIYAFTAILAFYLLVALLESFAWFNTGIRSVLFYTLITSTLFITWKWVIIPLRHLYKMGTIISHNEAANIIGKHFSNVSDKLLNTLQLKEQADLQKESLDLVYAGLGVSLSGSQTAVGKVDLTSFGGTISATAGNRIGPESDRR